MRRIKKSDELYGFTLTFKCKYDNADPRDLHKYVEKKLIRSTLWKKHNYIMFPEFTKKGQIHYHGVIQCPYDLNFARCMKMWQRLFGFVQKEFTIRHYDCKESCCIYPNDENPNVSSCWTHYCTKSCGKSGLWPIYNL